VSQRFADYYREIYARGLGGEQPKLPIEPGALEAAATAAMDPSASAYITAGAGSLDTIRANREAFKKWRIVPRMLRDVATTNLAATVLGTDMPAPVLLAPIGVQTLAHPDGELASARAAASLGVPFIASTAAAHTLEQIAEAAGPRWFQLYWPNEPSIMESLVARAERAGYSAIVLTVDTFIPGWKPLDLQDAKLPFIRGVGIDNFLQDPAFRAGLAKPPEEDLGVAIGHYLATYVNPSLTWDDLERLRGITKLPIVIKGIQHPDDAREALRRGIDGIVCSNHGGRQVDGAIASLDALPAIVDAVGGKIAVLFDSGIRSGSDVIKALALGADAVLIGRPYIWGLALDGQAGVETVLKCLLAELDLTLALTGHTEIAQLTPELLAS
jgi:lactate 2-monooxygenase